MWNRARRNLRPSFPGAGGFNDLPSDDLTVYSSSSDGLGYSEADVDDGDADERERERKRATGMRPASATLLRLAEEEEEVGEDLDTTDELAQAAGVCTQVSSLSLRRSAGAHGGPASSPPSSPIATSGGGGAIAGAVLGDDAEDPNEANDVDVDVAAADVEDEEPRPDPDTSLESHRRKLFSGESDDDDAGSDGKLSSSGRADA